jgi:hypothetical protein
VRLTVLLFAWIYLPGALLAQQESYIFKAVDLQRVTRELTGTENGWPLVNKLAAYKPEGNTFSLSPEALRTLDAYKSAAQRRDNIRQTYQAELANGAKMYAPGTITAADSLFDLFLKHTLDGNAAACVALIPVLQKSVDRVVRDSRRNRVKGAEAQLVELQGAVDSRKGLLGTWKPAGTGSMLSEEDGLRTGKASRARLKFLDGSHVTLQPQTTAIVRQSRLDLFSRNQETEVVLSQGSLMAGNTGGDNARNEFRLRAGSSVATVKSTRFWTETDGNDNVTMANYDGTVVVKTQTGSVTLERNQGVIISKGKAPAKVAQLLTAPQWRMSAADTTIYSSNAELRWSAVTDAASYQVEISPSRSFDLSVRSFNGKGTRLELDAIPVGISYARVRAFDTKGMRGNDSQVFVLVRNPDLQAPPLVLENEMFGAVYVQGDVFDCEGVTEPQSRVYINGEEVDVDARGRFSATIKLGALINKLDILAVDASGNRTQQNKLIIRMKEEQLFRLAWTVPSREEGQLKRAERIGVSGIAYAPLKVVVKTGRQQAETECKSNGAWEMYFNVPGDARTIEVRFVNRATGEEIARRTYYLY